MTYLVLLPILVTIEQESTKLTRVEMLCNSQEEVFIEFEAAAKL